jgi:nitrite reductase (cytochrome c-552)
MLAVVIAAVVGAMVGLGAWRLDFVAAENSMGFHAPQEAARLLGEAIDYGRQAQIAVEQASRSTRSSDATR